MKTFRNTDGLRKFINRFPPCGDFCFYMYSDGPAPHRFRFMYSYMDYTGSIG